jgi:isocitrate/isopropylmalate dehydrogenase
MLLDHLKESLIATRIRQAVAYALADGACTQDLGGTLSTGEATQTIIARYQQLDNNDGGEST